MSLKWSCQVTESQKCFVWRWMAVFWKISCWTSWIELRMFLTEHQRSTYTYILPWSSNEKQYNNYLWLLGWGISGWPEDFYSERLCQRLYDIIQRTQTGADSRLIKGALFPMLSVILDHSPIVLNRDLQELAEFGGIVGPVESVVKVLWKFSLLQWSWN